MKRGSVWQWINLPILPFALFVRAPILLLGRLLCWTGELLEQIGGMVPGLRK